MQRVQDALIVVLLGLAVWQLGARWVARPVRAPVELLVTIPTVPGQPVPVVAISHLDGPPGGRLDEVLGSGCALVYLFDPDCFACNESALRWAGLSAVKRGGVEFPAWFVAVTQERDKLIDFRARHGLGAPILFVPEPGAARLLGVPAVPTLWGVSSGVVRTVMRGSGNTVPEAVGTEWCDQAGG